MWLQKKFIISSRFKFLRSKLWVSLFSFAIGYFTHIFLTKSNSNYCNHNNRNEEIYHRDSLSAVTGHSFLVILIFSSVENSGRRKVIRETWTSGLNNTHGVRYFFVISGGASLAEQEESIKAEEKTHNDLLIFINLENNFYSLTQKILVSFGWLADVPVLDELSSTWTLKPFKNYQYVLKCDDDSFVRVDQLVLKLKTQFTGKKSEYLYWGFFDGRAKPKKSGKYKEIEWDICDNYLPYALGGGYVLSQKLVKFIVDNGNYLKIFKNEDISVGMWLASYNKLYRVHDPTFDTEYISRGCHNSYLITHKHSEIAMKHFHENIKKTGNLCPKEFQTRLSYSYNWDAPPSKCCVRNNPRIP